MLYGRTHGIPSVALRFGMFVPEPFLRYGIRLLYGSVDTLDVVRSVLTSIDALTTGKLTWGSCNVESAVPFQDGDAGQLARDPMPVLDTYYPGASQLLRERGVEALAPITVPYPMDHAKQVLGFEPESDFEQWLDELRDRPTSGHARARPGRERHRHPGVGDRLGDRRLSCVELR